MNLSAVDYGFVGEHLIQLIALNNAVGLHTCPP